jgi:superfamily II DNA/RNA helicase
VFHVFLNAMQELDLRAQPEIIVATPGRLIDLLRNSQARAQPHTLFFKALSSSTHLLLF